MGGIFNEYGQQCTHVFFFFVHLHNEHPKNYLGHTVARLQTLVLVIQFMIILIILGKRKMSAPTSYKDLQCKLVQQ